MQDNGKSCRGRLANLEVEQKEYDNGKFNPHDRYGHEEGSGNSREFSRAHSKRESSVNTTADIKPR